MRRAVRRRAGAWTPLWGAEHGLVRGVWADVGLGEMILQTVSVRADGGTCVPTSPRWRFEYSGWVREVGGCVPTSPRWGFEGSGWAREVGGCVPMGSR